MAINGNAKTNQRDKHQLPEKEFKIRDSPLTERYNNNEDIKTIYNLFAVILISLLVNTVIHDYTKSGKFHFGLRLILIGFNKFYLITAIWLLFNLFAVVLFYIFRLWASIRVLLQPKTVLLWDRLFLTLFITYYIASLYGVQKLVHYYAFHAGSAAVIILEEIRLLMKQYSFIRTNTPKILKFKPHSDQKLNLPNFQKYLYFFFAPTMIYRDEYPRTKQIRWRFVIINLAEVLFIVIFLSLVVERFLLPPFQDFGLRKFTKGELVLNIFGNLFPGILFILGGFYSVLHATQNTFAEILRFGDRMFYKEWWLSRSLSEYFKTWNVVVHDWLFTYIYKDMYEIIAPKNKMLARTAVFVISAIVHEWILTNVLNLFLPVQFLQFFLTGAILSLFNLLHLRFGNLAFWYALALGSGIQVNMYALEFIARVNCPSSHENSVINFFIPRFLTCDSIE